MPKITDWGVFIYTTAAFIVLQLMVVYYIVLTDMVKNWVSYRCNPIYMLFAEDRNANMVQCMMTAQGTYFKYLAQPFYYIIELLAQIGRDLSTNINDGREMTNKTRFNINNNMMNVFGVIHNLSIAIQRITISSQDIVGKIAGISITFMYLMSTSIMTMKSMWTGPPGELVRKVGKACFHGSTKIKMRYGIVKQIKDIMEGDILSDGGKIIKTYKLINGEKENFYNFEKQGIDYQDILCTGYHHVLYNNKWIKVKDYPGLSIDNSRYSTIVYTLETSNHRIQIGNIMFYDYEDDDLYV